MQTQKYLAPAAKTLLKTIEAMVFNNTPLGVSELSTITQEGNNIIFRVLNVLSEFGYVNKNADSKYTLSNKLFVIGLHLQNRFSLKNISSVYMEKLANSTQSTCQLQIADGDHMLSINTIYPEKDYYLTVRPGAHLYYHGNAFGKVLMAFMEEDRLQSILEKPLNPITSKTIVSKDMILQELEQVRQKGYATEFEEYVNGSYCIGAPIFDFENNVIASVGITAIGNIPNKSEIDYQIEQVIHCAQEISCAIGNNLIINN